MDIQQDVNFSDCDCSNQSSSLIVHWLILIMTSCLYLMSGYVYAVLLAISAFAGSMCSCHFNLLMTELGLKVRAALTTAVYEKVKSFSLNKIFDE